MAEGALKKLEEQLNCSICLDTYTDPKELQCHHVFCQKCLVRMVVRDQQGQLTLTCPTCRQVTPVPASGARGLQSAFHINSALEIRDSVKKIEHLGTPSLEGAVGRSSNVKRASYCADHSKREVELYCETCGELICMKCAIAGGKHNSHTYIELAEAFEGYKREIILSLEPVRKQLTTIKTALAQLNACCGEISDQGESVKASIHTTVKQLHQYLDTRQTELCDQVDDITQTKRKDLEVQKDNLTIIQEQLISYLECVQDSLQSGSYEEVLKMKITFTRHVKELIGSIQPAELVPNTVANISFQVSAEVGKVCQSYGLLVGPKYPLPEPSLCTVVRKGWIVDSVGETIEFELKAVDSDNQPCDFPAQSFQCEFVSELIEARWLCNVVRKKLGEYCICYIPTIKGKHKLHIKILGQHIKGSPFEISVRLPARMLGAPIAAIGGVVEPWGVALNHRGELVVTESRAHRVSVLSPKGKRLLTFGSFGDIKGCFNCPRGVTVDKDGNIFVADSGNHHIQKFSGEGQFLATTGKCTGFSQFNSPQDVAYHAMSNQIYVVDLSKTIHILNSDLTYVKQHNFAWQQPLCIDCCNGLTYVVDTAGRNCLIRAASANTDGISRSFGRKADLQKPLGIAVDIQEDTVYVSDGKCVCLFTSKGMYFKELQPDRGICKGLAVDNDGVVYVCAEDCILMF